MATGGAVDAACAPAGGGVDLTFGGGPPSGVAVEAWGVAEAEVGWLGAGAGLDEVFPFDCAGTEGTGG